MSHHKGKSLSPELEGIWIIREKSKYEKTILIIYEIFTLAIMATLFFEIILNLGLVLIAAFLFSVSFVFSIDFYTNRYPQLAFPISQIIIFIASAYTEIFLLYSQNPNFLVYPVFSMIPNIFQLFIGILCTGRVIFGMEIMQLHKKSKLALVPISKFHRESLSKFESNLKLTDDKIQHEFKETSVKNQVKLIFRSLSISLINIFLLLTPLWFVLLTDEYIYPYIILIPTILLVLILIIYTTSQKRKTNDKKSENKI